MKTGISAIILAAGQSRRMGRSKPLLTLGGGTIIAHVAGSFRAAGIEDITVVLGHRGNDIIPELQKNKLSWVVNEQYEQGMLSSVKIGLASLGERIEGFFIMPADIPLVRPATLRDLYRFHVEHPGRVIYPCFQEQRGHPPLIPALFKQEIMMYEGAGGLRQCMQAWNHDSLDVAVAAQGVLMDMDTPDDYAAILRRFERIDIPSKEEALALLDIHQHNNPLARAHALKVASVAVFIGQTLCSAGQKVNVSLIEAAGILHDIAKGHAHHARKGAQLIAANGFQSVAVVAGQHMDLIFNPLAGIHEAEVIYLADKMVSGSSIVQLEKRLRRKKEQFSNNPEALERMAFRMNQAIRIQQAIGDLIGESIDDMIFH